MHDLEDAPTVTAQRPPINRTLTQYRLCPHSRGVRLVLAEFGLEVTMSEEQPWEWRPAFLALNPAGELPVLAIQGGPILCGAYAISEYLAETLLPDPDGAPRVALFPGDGEGRAEVRRLVDWFGHKLDREVTREVLYEKVYARQQAPDHAPEGATLRAIQANLRYHLGYIAYLADHRRWLAGDDMSFADMVAAAHLSVLDYLGEVAWEEHPKVKAWYARVKSRPSFRGLLADRVPGLPPPPHYTDLDF